MALEAVVFPQDPLSYNTNKDLYTLFGLGGGANWSCSSFGPDFECDQIPLDFLQTQTEITYPFADWNSPLSLSHSNPSPEAIAPNGLILAGSTPPLEAESSSLQQIRPRRRRPKTRKNKEEIENQRMTHIAVERNRRKQMNEYLSVLRSLMPDSYVQRGDQASIIGGAINYVKELEQQVQFLSTTQTDSKGKNNSDGGGCSFMPFSEFFSFPQFTASCGDSSTSSSSSSSSSPSSCVGMGEGEGQSQSSIADIEVTMVENHANLKIRAKRRPKQLLKMVAGLHSLSLTVLHLNVSSVEQIVLYCLSVKVEDDCKLSSVDDIAAALHQLLCRIEEDSLLN